MAVAISTSDTSVVDIPFLIRGRIIDPGDDAVEFGGRVGARFRIPDPAKYADQLVLNDAGDLADLRDTPIAEVIDFLAELGPRLVLDENPLLQAAYELCLEAGELTESILAPVYDDFPKWFGRERLHAQVDSTLGKYIDGWVELGAPGQSSARMRAIGVRQLHIIAGNVPVTVAITVTRSALTKGDCLIKMPSNDPYTAAAVVRSMIDLDPDHPVTKHFAVAYWKGGDEALERKIIRPSRIEKLTAWGGMSSMKHIQKYLVPGIELIAFNPKWSISIVGHEALESPEAMEQAAHGVAVRVAEWNQTGCSCTRVTYVECGTDEADLERLEQFGHAIHNALGALPEWFSTVPKRPDRDLDAELEAVALDDEFYRVIGDTSFGGVVISRTGEPVDFADILNNRIVNLVPVADITAVGRWVHGDETQTIGVYPPRLRDQLRDDLATYGAQRIVPLVTDLSTVRHTPAGADPLQSKFTAHDGTMPLQRMVRWVTEESADLR
jgi:hypothetical protein